MQVEIYHENNVYYHLVFLLAVGNSQNLKKDMSDFFLTRKYLYNHLSLVIQ